MTSILENVAMALADLNRGCSEVVLDVQQAIHELNASADDTGCTDDLIVVSRSALERVTGYAARLEPVTGPDPRD